MKRLDNKEKVLRIKNIITINYNNLNMKRNKKKTTNDLRYQKLEKVIQIKLSHRQDKTANPQGILMI